VIVTARRVAPALLASAFVVASLALAACGKGAATTTIVTTRNSAGAPPPAGGSGGPSVQRARAFARAVNLTADDVPGFKPNERRSEHTRAERRLEREMLSCAGLGGAKQAVLEEGSKSFQLKQGVIDLSVSSEVTVEPNARTAQSALAAIRSAHVRGCFSRYLERAFRAEHVGGATVGPVTIQDRLWFNEANDSHYFLVPGLVVLVMTLIGAMLTALVMAREWERGTFEAMFVTPIRSGEILVGKTAPYFILGMIGLFLCILSGKYLFEVPLRGSTLVLTVVSVLYLLVTLATGLLISSVTKSQFIASQVALVVTFLPAMMLSGFLFDLRSMPDVIRAITYIMPARYYVALLQTIFLAGDIWSVIVPNAAVLAAMAAGLLTLSRMSTKKRLA